MYASQITPELIARIDYAARAASKHAQAVRKLQSLKLPPGSIMIPGAMLPASPAQMAAYRAQAAQMAERTKQMRGFAIVPRLRHRSAA